MSYLTVEAFHKKILAFAITSAISASVQSGYTEILTTNSNEAQNINSATEAEGDTALNSGNIKWYGKGQDRDEHSDTFKAGAINDENGLLTLLQVYGQQDVPHTNENNLTIQIVTSIGQSVPVNVEKGGALGLLEAARDQSLYIHFTDEITPDKNKAFVVTNFGEIGADAFLDSRGDLNVLDFSADVSRPSLYFIQHGSNTDEVKCRQDKQDTLALVNGRLKKASGFANIGVGSAADFVFDSSIIKDPAIGKQTGISTGDIFSAGGAWILYSYSKATQDLKDNVPGYHAKTNGFSIGADNLLEEDQDIEVGIAYTYAKGRVEGKDDSRSKIDTDTHIFSLYSSYEENDFFFDGRMSYSFGKNKGHRYVGGNQHDAKYDTQSWGVGLVAGYTYPLGYEWSWQPQAAFNYYTIKTDDYTESARDSAQAFLSHDQVNNGKYDIMELGAGLKLMGDINTDTMVIKPELGFMGYHDFKNDPVAITAHFAAGGESFLINGADRDANRYQFDATINMEIQNNTTITLSYLHHWADSFKLDGLIARVRYDF